ncbi:glycosyltransferase [Sediminicoccus sp. KRV36]|uniref:glycosyltransferase family 2 protein n=1 Tax=Sediminicoccus sp. KRV36 TaxID=3133721 RepID=UPI00200D7E4E|nr:glycosyltransferase [Sediminicoccus rosea]UPY36712.1 glycosyltransferase [Sediminicoccus rosea]
MTAVAAGHSHGAPAISVLIPTFNRREIALRCIAALDAQQLPPGTMEVIMVDDGSSDGTAAAILAAGARMATPITCLTQSNAGANAARNRAIAASRAPLALFLNDDSIAAPGMVAEHLRQHAAHPAETDAVLGGLLLPEAPPPGLFEVLHHDAALAVRPAGEDLGWRAFYTFNLSVKTSLLRRHGGFNPDLRWHEDIEFGRRLSADGLRVLHAPAATAVHLHPMNEAGWLGIADREGRALAAWLVHEPGLRDELVQLGLHSLKLGTRAPRHAMADLVLKLLTEPAALWVARRLARRQPKAAAAVYRKLFQARKRRAIDAALPDGFV